MARVPLDEGAADDLFYVVRFGAGFAWARPACRRVRVCFGMENADDGHPVLGSEAGACEAEGAASTRTGVLLYDVDGRRRHVFNDYDVSVCAAAEDDYVAWDRYVPGSVRVPFVVACWCIGVKLVGVAVDPGAVALCRQEPVDELNALVVATEVVGVSVGNYVDV